jgi:hypothetical protein
MVWIVLIGIGAGLTSALLFAALASGHALAIALFYLTPLPIMLAGVAWSWMAGLIAAVTAAVLLAMIFSGWFLLAFLIGVGFPAVTLSYLALLARPSTSGAGQLEWYPPGRIVLAAALIAATATTLTIPAFGTDVESYRGALKATFERVLRAQTDTPAGEPLKLPGIDDTDRALTNLTILMPPAAAAFSMITSLGNLWLASRVASVSGRLARPWPHLPALAFPGRAPLLLAAAVAGTFLPGIAGVVAGLFTATLLLAYGILGLAVVHGASRALAGRLFLLIAVWLSVLVLGWPLLLAALLGLTDHFIDLRGRFAARADLPTQRPPDE